MATASKRKSKTAHRRPTHTTATPVSETFTTQPQPAEAVRVERGHVQLFINGRDRGQAPTTGLKLKDFVIGQASAAGIRTFSVYCDGQKADTSMSNRAMSSFAKVEIVAKDARG